MKLKLLLLPMVFIALTGCSETNSQDKKYSFTSGEYNYQKGEKKYSNTSMFKFNNQTGEAWRMGFEKDSYVWKKIKHID